MQRQVIPKTVVLLGQTGAGKSSTGNTICESSVFQVGDSFESSTKQIQSGKNQKRNLQVIDCVGYDDNSSFSKEQIQTLLRDLVKTLVIQKNAEIHCFLLVVGFTNRLASFKTDIEQSIQIFGEEILKILIVLFINRTDREINSKTFMEQLKQMASVLDIMKLDKEYLRDNWFMFWNNNNPIPGQLDTLQSKISNIRAYSNEEFKKIHNQAILKQREQKIIEEKMKKISEGFKKRLLEDANRMKLLQEKAKKEKEQQEAQEQQIKITQQIEGCTIKIEFLTDQMENQIVKMNKFYDDEKKRIRSNVDCDVTNKIIQRQNTIIMEIENEKNQSIIEERRSFTNKYLNSISNKNNFPTRLNNLILSIEDRYAHLQKNRVNEAMTELKQYKDNLSQKMLKENEEKRKKNIDEIREKCSLEIMNLNRLLITQTDEKYKLMRKTLKANI